jgi:hypothetical protein
MMEWEDDFRLGLRRWISSTTINRDHKRTDEAITNHNDTDTDIVSDSAEADLLYECPFCDGRNIDVRGRLWGIGNSSELHQQMIQKVQNYTKQYYAATRRRLLKWRPF